MTDLVLDDGLNDGFSVEAAAVGTAAGCARSEWNGVCGVYDDTASECPGSVVLSSRCMGDTGIDLV